MKTWHWIALLAVGLWLYASVTGDDPTNWFRSATPAPKRTGPS